MLLLGIDIGTSFIKVSILDAATRKVLCSIQHPEKEAGIISLQPGWAEQSPLQWWQHFKQALLKANATGQYNPKDIQAIGIAYQMHGLVVVDKHQQVLRNSIIWCDSRAVTTGNQAFQAIGKEKCLSHLLNSPGNFTASKLAWVREHEPQVYEKVHRVMLPGDFIAMQLTGEITTTVSALSEGIFWDFKNSGLSTDILTHYRISETLIPPIQPVFSEHGRVTATVAHELGLSSGTPVTYKAGDQPNNALSLNVLEPGEVAATAGTSGVIYAVTDQLMYDQQSRINSFAHVNYQTPADEKAAQTRIGILLCLNGTGIFNNWIRKIAGNGASYPQLNDVAASIPVGSEGVIALPFGNGAERILNNRIVGAHLQHIDLNVHTTAHLFRAVQEGIACSFRYGLDIMRENKIEPTVIRAGFNNLFLSEVFLQSFVNTTGVPVELYQSEGSSGAAIGAGIGVKYFSEKEAFHQTRPLRRIEPGSTQLYDQHYARWKNSLQQAIKKETET